MKYSGVYIKVSDFAKSLALFEKILGRPAHIYAPDRWANFDGFGIYCPNYDLENGVELSSFDQEASVGNNIIIEFNVDDVVAEYKRLQELGLIDLSEICTLNVQAPYKFFHFKDYDGNQFEVGQYL